jgi:hypothetical protein
MNLGDRARGSFKLISYVIGIVVGKSKCILRCVYILLRLLASSGYYLSMETVISLFSELCTRLFALFFQYELCIIYLSGAQPVT